MTITDLISIILSVIPMLLIIGALILFTRRARTNTNRMNEFMNEYLEEMRKQTEIQNRIAAALEKKQSNG